MSETVIDNPDALVRLNFQENKRIKNNSNSWNYIIGTMNNSKFLPLFNFNADSTLLDGKLSMKISGPINFIFHLMKAKSFI